MIIFFYRKEMYNKLGKKNNYIFQYIIRSNNKNNDSNLQRIWHI